MRQSPFEPDLLRFQMHRKHLQTRHNNRGDQNQCSS